MRSIKGRPLAPGYAMGQAVVAGIESPIIPRYSIEATAIDAEFQRFHESLERSRQDLEQLQSRVALQHGPEEAEIFSAHLALLADQQFVARVKDYVGCELVNVEQAIDVIVSQLADSLKHLDNEYLREREQDVRDLGRRVLRHLVRRDLSPLRHLPPDSVLVIHELLPSDVLDLDCAHLVGMVLESGSDTSHAAILTRSWGIAAVSGIADATQWIEPGAPILVDGQTGEVVIHPQPTDVERLVRRKQRYDRSVSIALAAESRECITQDGVQITLYANIARPDECAQVARHHLNGVGLFRTEYLFLDSHEAPSFQCQLEAYRNAAQCLPDQPLVIRTL